MLKRKRGGFTADSIGAQRRIFLFCTPVLTGITRRGHRVAHGHTTAGHGMGAGGIWERYKQAKPRIRIYMNLLYESCLYYSYKRAAQAGAASVV
jgi:hypothetical protein